MSIEQWRHPTISSSVTIFSSCPQSFPASGSFPVSQLFNQVAKVSDLQLLHQSSQWIFRVDFLYDWPFWSPCSPRESHESSPTPQLESINSSVFSLLYGPNSLKIMTPGKTIALTIQTFVGKVTSVFLVHSLGFLMYIHTLNSNHLSFNTFISVHFFSAFVPAFYFLLFLRCSVS